MKKRVGSFLIITLIVLLSHPVNAVQTGGVQYNMPIDYSFINETNLNKEAENLFQSYINTYSYAIDTANLNDNIKLVLNNAAQKTANNPESVVEQQLQSTNSALLFEYTQSIAKSNVAQQLVLDNNLKETLKFLNSEAAKKLSITPKQKYDAMVKHILAENDVRDFESEEQEKEANLFDDLDLFDIKIDDSKKNIFAA